MQNRPELAPGLVTFACPELTYAPARAVTQRRCSGIILKVKNMGMSLIHCPELRTVFERDVCVAAQQIAGFKEGQHVTFAVTLNEQSEPQAFDLQADPPSPPAFMSGEARGGFEAGVGAVFVPRRVFSTPGGTVRLEEMPVGGTSAFVPESSLGVAKDAKANDSSSGNVEELGEFYGVIKSYDPFKGFGFIMCKALKDQYYSDVYVHGDACSHFQLGAEVKFTAHLFNGKLQGKDIKDATGQVAPGVGLPEELGIFIGELKVFHFDRGFGFIGCDQLRMQGFPGDAFLHHTQRKEFQPGDTVAFTAVANDGRLLAKDLQDPQTVLAGDVQKGMAVLDHMQIMQRLPGPKPKKVSLY